jgi:undecaprenyl phosphate-alpha-L-ara4N flippase subunit ArnE
MFATLSPLTWVGLLGTPLLIAVGQVLFKLASGSVGEFSLRALIGLATNPVMIAALTLYGLGTIVWIYVLRTVPLTIAYSFMGLTFCFVPLLAHLVFGELLTLRYFLGAVLIFAGLLAING